MFTSLIVAIVASPIVASPIVASPIVAETIITVPIVAETSVAETSVTGIDYLKGVHETNSVDIVTHILRLVKKLNEGNRIVNDMCEMLEEKVGIITGSDKPNCRYNASFISNDTINLFDVGENVRQFLLSRKKEHCKAEKLECGELTIILKLVDLINSVVHIALKLNSPQELVVNSDVISFDELFTLYISSLDNYEVLSNITLKKQRANVILDRERQRIKQIQGRGSMQRVADDISIYLGEPLKDALGYVGNTIGSSIGSLVGSTIEGTAPALALSLETKLGIVGLIILYIRK